MPQTSIHRYFKHGTLPQLKVFEAVARHANYTRAAEELYMAQPTVSVHIRKLTETVGLQLFEQVGKRAHLTEAGRELQDCCREIFSSITKIEDTLGRLRGLEAGRLRLAVSTTGKYFAPRLLAAFALKHPGIEASLHVHNRLTLLGRLNDNEDDLYILSDPPQNAEVVMQHILPNPMVVFARADHPLANQKAIPFERFAQEPLLMREPGSGTRMVAQQIFDKYGLQPKVRMELSTDEAIMQAILGGLGVSIRSRYSLGLDVEHKQLVTLNVEGFPIERHWYFVYPVGKQLPLAAQAFMDYSREHVQRLVLDHLASTAR